MGTEMPRIQHALAATTRAKVRERAMAGQAVLLSTSETRALHDSILHDGEMRVRAEEVARQSQSPTFGEAAELHAATLVKLEQLCKDADTKSAESERRPDQAYWAAFRDGLRRAVSVVEGRG
jgi:hypothetical protein